MTLHTLRRTASLGGLVAALVFPLAAGAATAPRAPSHPPGATGPRIRIVTSFGTIYAVLDPRRAPKTTANFLHYVDTRFFNGGTFFRAIPGFVIQGGNKTRENQDAPPIALEDPKATGLRNTDGALAMARTSDPNSATSEFFIDDGPQAFLDGPPGQPGYAVFGHVTSGMDVVRKIVHQPASSEMLDKPVTILKIERVR